MRWWIVGVGGLLAALVGSASAERSAALSATGSCPTREALVAALQLALPDLVITADPSGPELRIIVTDHADAVRVEVEGVVRTFSDAARQCDERAAKVAIVVALALDPPLGRPLDPPPISPPDARPAQACASAPTSRCSVEISSSTVLVAQEVAPAGTTVHVESGGVVDAAAGGVLATGIDMHVVFARGDVGVVVGGALTSPVDLPMAAVTARVQRLPIDIAVRAQIRTDHARLAAELGPRFAIQRSQGIVDGMPTAQATRLETGARGAARLEVWPGRDYGAFVALQAEFVPRPSLFTLPKHQEVGAMPSWWVGTSLGLAFRML
jgi:hypothetical protein